MKKLFVLAALIVIVLALPIVAQVTNDRDGVQVGSGEVLTPTSSTALTVPGGAEWAVITVRNAGIHMEFDASAATTSDLYLGPGTYQTAYVARATPNIILASIRFIDSSDGASTVYVKYFRRPTP